jgi:hypothetical protein
MTSLGPIFCILATFAQEPPSLEPIHPQNRVFTADQFREKLLLLRGEKAVLNLFKDSKIPLDKQKKLLDFAQRLAETASKTEGKKDLPVPPELLRNPDVQKILENQKLLEWLADNERIQEMAQRMAERWNLPQLAPRPNLPAPANDSTSPPRGNSAGQAPPRTGEGNDDPALNENNPPGAGANPDGKPAETSPNPTDPGNGDPTPSTTGPNSGAEKPRHGPLRGLTKQLRKIGPLSRSATMDRVEEMIDGSLPETGQPVAPPLPSTAPAPPTPPVPSESTSLWDAWNQLPWVESLPTPLAEIPLPPGLDGWAPSLDNIPIPAIPLPNIDIGQGMLPSLPNLPTSIDTTLSPSSWGGPLLIIALIAVGLWLAHSAITNSWLEPASHRPGSFFRPRRPTRALDITSRSSIREWFEFAAFTFLGPRAGTMSHADWARAIQATGSAPAWPDLYAQARYLPPDQPVDPTLAQQAAAELSRLTDSASP